MLRNQRHGDDSLVDVNMEWAVPAYPRKQVDLAGKLLVKYFGERHNDNEMTIDEWIEVLNIINNWRSSHAYPLNTFQVGLRNKARKHDPSAVIAQRTKRLWSIWHKLDRFNTMNLSQMQDIGGCRAILATIPHVYGLLDDYKTSRIRHNWRTLTDYISNPRSSGYRGVHIIFEYNSDRETTSVYNNLRIEMQLRTVLQHAWATSVEIIGTFTRQALKSSLGEKDWLRFFALMGTVIALREQAAPVPNTPSDQKELFSELKEYANRTNAANRLRTIAETLQTLEQPSAMEAKAHMFLLELTPDSLKVRGFHANQQKQAQDEYIRVESEISKGNVGDAVLVSVDSLSSLRRAYPNYFLDTRVFSDVLDETLSNT
jgi:ppGpp synthetase/RelA/SpoT-type nucleotidyltranferase